MYGQGKPCPAGLTELDILWCPFGSSFAPLGAGKGFTGVGFLRGGEWHTCRGGGGAYTGRYLGERMNSIRRGGGGVAWSGDACVALARGSRRSRDQGDASVPTPHHPNPRPYGYEGASEAT